MECACISDWDETLRSNYLMRDWMAWVADATGSGSLHVQIFDSLLSSFQSKGCNATHADYESLVIDASRNYAEFLRGRIQSEVAAIAEEFVSSDVNQLFGFTEDLLAFLHTRHVSLFIISGGPTEPLEAYARKFPIRHVYATSVRVEADGRYSKTLATHYGREHEKQKAVYQISSRYRIVVGIGDSASDAPLWAAAPPTARFRLVSARNPGGIVGDAREVTPSEIMSAVQQAVSLSVESSYAELP